MYDLHVTKPLTAHLRECTLYNGGLKKINTENGTEARLHPPNC